MFQRYKELSPRPCNKHHLLGECKDVDCQFDHGYMEPEFIDIMRYHTKRRQCLDGRSCRSLNCIYAHHCQIDGCTGEGSCKMTRVFHNFDPRVAHWVGPGNDNPQDEETEKFEAMWNGTGGGLADNQSPQAFSIANTTYEGTSSDLLDTAESASNFSIEW